MFIIKKDLIDRINRECLAHKNSSFDVEAYKCYWYKSYTSKKVFNFGGKATGYKWVEEKYNTSHNSLGEVDAFFRSLSLPYGLSYSYVDVLKQDETLSEPVRKYSSASKQFDRKYIIHVSKTYCDSIVNNISSSKLVFESEVKSSLLSAANSFKDRIKRDHSDIIEEIATKFNLNYTTIDRKGVNIYSDNKDILIFEKCGLKDFTEEYQVLGFALAIIDCAIPYLMVEEYFMVEYRRTTADIFSATIHKNVLTSSQELKEW